MKMTKRLGFMAVAVFAVTLAAAIFYGMRASHYARTINNHYARALYGLSESVGEIDLALAKGVLVTQAPQLSRLTTEIWRQTAAAQTALGQLPLSENKIETTERFLSQVGSYAYSLGQKGVAGQPMSDEERQQLLNLSGYAQGLKDSLLELKGEWEDGNLNFDLKTVHAGDRSVSYMGELDNLEAGFSDYPTLIYDGPFSDHLEQAEAKALVGRKAISDVQALKGFTTLLGEERVKSPKVTGMSEGKLAGYNLSAGDGQISGCLSKQGGLPIWFLDSRELGTPKLSPQQAVERAKAFLERIGLTSMVENYYIQEGKSITVNFAYNQDGVTLYGDLVKVKVALDNGDVIGFEAQGYLMNHHRREIPQPVITVEQAKAAISNVVELQSQKQTMIPTPDGRELPCYEFLGKCGKRNFLMYVNTQTGQAENALLLLETENGVLTL